MTAQSNIYAGVAGYVGRPDEKGSVGVFRRGVAADKWSHVLTHLETHTVLVHPTDPAMVFAGTDDGVWRSKDHGATFQQARFPDRGKQIWSFLVDLRDDKRIYAGASPLDAIAVMTGARAGNVSPDQASKIVPTRRSPCALCAWRNIPKDPTKSMLRWR